MQRENKKKILLIMPAYNEEKTIAPLILEAEKYVDEILVVDDGSKDHTAEIAQRMGATVIKHPENMGYGAALITGFKYALKTGADIAVTMDADGQHLPSQIPLLVKPLLDEKADMVIGSRFLGRTDIPKYREIGVKTITTITKLATKLKITDAQSGFRAYTYHTLQKIIPQLDEKGMGLSLQILDKVSQENLTIMEVPIVIRYDLEKTSSKNPFRHGLELISLLIREIAQRRPLIYLGLPGMISLLIGLISGVYLLLLFNITRYFSIPVAIITLGTILIGLLLSSTALILHTIIIHLKKWKREI